MKPSSPRIFSDLETLEDKGFAFLQHISDSLPSDGITFHKKGALNYTPMQRDAN